MKFKLESCPCCGGKAEIVYGAKRKNYQGKEVTGAVVYCTNCDLSIFRRDPADAIEAWNRREK